MSGLRAQGSDLVGTHQAAIAGDISSQNSR